MKCPWKFGQTHKPPAVPRDLLHFSTRRCSCDAGFPEAVDSSVLHKGWNLSCGIYRVRKEQGVVRFDRKGYVTITGSQHHAIPKPIGPKKPHHPRRLTPHPPRISTAGGPPERCSDP